MTADFSQLVLYFSLYSFYGWICETVYCSVLDGHLAKRGFLSGPYCPIYGVGALIVLGFCLPAADHPVLVFLLSMLLASLLEYFTGWLFETFLQMRLWDYSNNHFNLKGRVCLLNSTLFGLLGLAAVYWLHPLSQKLVWLLKPEMQKAVASILMVVFSLDFLRSLKVASGLTEHLNQLRLRLEALKNSANEVWPDVKALPPSLHKLRSWLENREPVKSGRPLSDFLKSLTGPKDPSWRLLRNYPSLTHKNLKEELVLLRESWSSDRGAFWGGWRGLASAVKGKLAAWAKTGPAFRKVGGLEAVWVFTVGSLAGFAAETLLHSISAGSLTVRQGLVYGPLCPVYGLTTLLSFVFLRQNPDSIFLGSAVIGGAVEYLASLILEKSLHISFWDYSGQPFAISGRTSLLMMFVFGLAGSVCLKKILPQLSRLLGQISNRPRLIVSWALVICLGGDLLLSGAAVWGWSERHQGRTAESVVLEVIDRAYPDEAISEMFPGLSFKGLNCSKPAPPVGTDRRPYPEKDETTDLAATRPMLTDYQRCDDLMIQVQAVNGRVGQNDPPENQQTV